MLNGRSYSGRVSTRVSIRPSERTPLATTRQYEDLQVWQDARAKVKEIYKLTKQQVFRQITFTWQLSTFNFSHSA